MSSWKLIIPKATTNLIKNPSFEIGTTGWQISGTGSTITRVSSNSFHGAYSLEVFANGAFHGTRANVTDDTEVSTEYTFTVMVIGDVGKNARLQFYDSVGGTQAGALVPLTGEWQRIEFTATFGTGSARYVYVQGSSSQTFNIDSAQLEQVSSGNETTYCDGDQPGCKWNGVAHNSTSTRNQFEATGGQTLDLSDDLNFVIAQQDGTGMSPVNNLSSPLSLQPGELFDGQTIQGRNFSLIGSIIGDDVENFHEKKQALIKALNPNVTTIGKRSQPRTLQYTGATMDKEIQAVYDGGLEQGLPLGFAQQDITLRLKADDPLFYQIGESAAVLDVNDSADFRIVAGKVDGLWDSLGPPDAAGTYTTAHVFAEDDVYIYVGGNFLNFNNIANADYIARYEKSTGTWSALGTGLNGTCRTLIIGSDGTLYAGGHFTTAGGNSANYIASWSGTLWSALGTGLNNYCLAFAIGSDGTLYAGGDFTTAGGSSANSIASWNGSSWSALGTGLTGGSGFCRALTIGSSETLYAGGDFTTAGGSSASNIASWNGSSWSALGTGLNFLCYTVTIGLDGILYAGGAFTTAGGSSANRIASWNGLSWFALGAGLNNTCYVIVVGSDGILYAGGQLTAAGGTSMPDRMARWNGSTWFPLDVNLPGISAVEDIFISSDDNLYFGFSATGAGNYAGSVAISYSGTYQSYPYIKIKRDGGTSAKLISIANVIIDAELLFNYDLQDGEELIIDTRPGKQSVISSSRGNVYGELLPNSDFGNFYLLPSNGTGAQENIITAFVDEVGSPTIEAAMIWKNAYISED